MSGFVHVSQAKKSKGMSSAACRLLKGLILAVDAGAHLHEKQAILSIQLCPLLN